MNVYQSLKDILIQYVFGGLVPNEFQQIAIEIFVLLAWLFCLSLPFVVCFWFIKFLSVVVTRFFSHDF